MKDLKSERSSTDDTYAGDYPQRPLRKKLATLSLGGSRASIQAMWSDWAVHFAMAPDLQLDMVKSATESWLQWARYVSAGCPDDPDLKPIEPAESDRRFRGRGWSQPPFAAMAQGFLLLEELADQAARSVPGLGQSRQDSVAFVTRQILDAMAPSNSPITNPDVLARTLATGGANIHHGLERAFRDIKDGPTPAGNSQVGEAVATTPGKVVYRNHLIELIQYEPTTDTVHPEPILIVPAWIMKYYILDLSPENSLVRYLTEQGFTVFMISWRNPKAEDAHYGMQDYLDLGPRAALDVIESQSGAKKVHSAGYCLGGTLLSIAAATMARDGNDRLASMTLFAAQTDFSEPGELSLFINESQVSFLEDVMQEQGYLDASQMMSAFQMLRSNDLIWSQMVRKYLLGEDDLPMNDLMAWNADTTRMPARMHSEYLRHMFLNNDLAAGRFHVDGHHVSLRDIRLPVFVVGTEGALHTDEVMSAVVSKTGGLRTERRMSHVYVMDVPTYPKPLIITDAAINIEPDLETKADIIQNAIDLARAIGIEVPKVAILSAVETVNPRMQSTIEAAALCKMADRGQITGGLLDGPLAFDNAISLRAVATKSIVSPVAGQADILLAPDLEAGNMIAKQLMYLAGAEAAGVVLGARVPIILTSRADDVKTRTASAAIAALFSAAQRP
ncbi:bifunctional enoyl-CoA hydratase/phosphate acetyltransferase [Roseovarius sp. E0-M6]|uniref:bifunctional enoyl-CoA hydratase/phosphate acetyltransferase n=1 Tax=Roseovarius sp. E0-M6 TaxID=3127118 RepID=UPI0030100DDE